MTFSTSFRDIVKDMPHIETQFLYDKFLDYSKGDIHLYWPNIIKICFKSAHMTITLALSTVQEILMPTAIPQWDMHACCPTSISWCLQIASLAFIQMCFRIMIHYNILSLIQYHVIIMSSWWFLSIGWYLDWTAFVIFHLGKEILLSLWKCVKTTPKRGILELLIRLIAMEPKY